MNNIPEIKLTKKVQQSALVLEISVYLVYKKNTIYTVVA